MQSSDSKATLKKTSHAPRLKDYPKTWLKVLFCLRTCQSQVTGGKGEYWKSSPVFWSRRARPSQVNYRMSTGEMNNTRLWDPEAIKHWIHLTNSACPDFIITKLSASYLVTVWLWVTQTKVVLLCFPSVKQRHHHTYFVGVLRIEWSKHT